MKENVLTVVGTLTEAQLKELETICKEIDYGFTRVNSVAEAEPYLKDATIIYGNSAELIKKAPGLKWFHSASAGVNTYIPVIKKETLLTNSAGAFGLSIAEHTVMVILMMLRQMPQYQKYIAQRQWKKGLSQESIYGKRITVLGTGDIGSHIAERLQGFKPACITGVSRSGKKKEFFDQCYPVTEINRLLPDTDILITCIPETGETINLLNEERISLLPEDAYVVNVGRGSLIDEEALMKALNSEKLAGAALDVFRTEPLPEDSPLYETKNLIITPHCSGNLTLDYTKETNYNQFKDNLIHYANNEPLEHVVDKKLGY